MGSGQAKRGIKISRHALTASNTRLLRVTFGLILATSLVCSLYASFFFDARGLYSDGAAYLVAIYERQWFFFPSEYPRCCRHIEARSDCPFV